jgi:hypothetical protein
MADIDSLTPRGIADITVPYSENLSHIVDVLSSETLLLEWDFKMITVGLPRV